MGLCNFHMDVMLMRGFSSTIWRAGCGVVALSLACLAPLPAHAGAALLPSDSNVRTVVRDRANHLHTVWVEESTGNRSRLMYQLQGLSGAPLTQGMVIRDSVNRIRRPHIRIDSSGTVHLLWQERFAKTAGARRAQGTKVWYARLSMGKQGPYVVRQDILNQRQTAMHPARQF